MRRFVVVEGLIGAGKTSLCRLLAREWGARLVLEPSETNPFLEPFYADPVRFAFPVQMFYLVNRWRQQDKIRQQELFEPVVVSDYLFAKDRMFAEKTLEPMEFELYDRFASALGETSPVPDLVIWLEAPIPVVMERIRKRNAPGEKAITRDYLEDLRQRYLTMWSEWHACPILTIDNRDMNYVDDPAARDDVLERIQAGLEGRFPPNASAPGSHVDREVEPSLFGSGGSTARSERVTGN